MTKVKPFDSTATPDRRGRMQPVRHAMNSGNFLKAAKLLSALLENNQPARPKIVYRIVTGLRQDGDLEIAADFLEKIIVLLPEMQTVKTAKLLFSMSRQKSAARLLRALMDEKKLTAVDEILTAANIFLHVGNTKSLSETLHEAMDTGAGGPTVGVVLAEKLEIEGSTDKALEIIERVLENSDDGVVRGKANTFKLDILSKYDPNRFEHEFETMSPKDKSDLPDNVREWASYQRGDQSKNHENFSISDEFTLTHRSGDKCLLIFGSYLNFKKYEKIQKIDSLLDRKKISVLTIVDSKRTLCLAGVGEYRPSRTKTGVKLQSIMQEYGFKNYATFGGSGGGLPALLYGSELKCSGCITFSGVTFLPKEKDVKIARALGPLRLLKSRLPDGVYDARTSLENDKKTIVHCYYPSKSPFDVEQAMHLSNLPNVKLFAVDSQFHSSYIALDKSHELENAFSNFFDAIGW